MSDKRNEDIKKIQQEYKYGFKTHANELINTGKGLNEEIIKTISKAKNEPEWVLEYRLSSYRIFLEKENPKWGPDLSGINFDEFTYFIRNVKQTSNDWNEVPEEIKTTFERLGIPQAERDFLAGVSTQFESEVVYHSTQKELDSKGIIYVDTDTALRKYPDLFKKYFGTVVSNTDNKYAALNGAVWSGGSFIYVPKGAKLEKPIQSYFRMNSNQLGQFERTLIIVDEDAEINYVEGCTAPIWSKESLHAAVVEVIAHKNSRVRYTTIQNWSSNVLNLVTKRANVYQNAHMEWIDGNMGSSLNMKYPSCMLLEPYAKGTMISIAVAGENQNQDAGAKMIHLAHHTSSNIISKSISHSGGRVNYRGLVYMDEKAEHSKSHVECDTIILDDRSYSDTVPTNIIKNNSSTLEHEATASKISEEQLYYLMSRGLTEEQATEMILMGFIEPFARELPMEYAVELNQLIKMEMEGSIG